MNKQIIIPPSLQKGDTIGIVSTASKIDREIVEQAVNFLKEEGFQTVLGKSIYNRHNQFAGTDQERTHDLQLMLDNSDIKTIVCSRGGYGSIRTIQNINWENFIKSPKWIVGFSDVTTLHSQLNRLNIASIHGVMPRYFTENGTATQSYSTLNNAWLGNALHYNISPSEYNKQGISKGELVGGNLSILYSLRGTPYDLDTNNKILFIEDLSEQLYHLDRMMMNLKTGGLLSNLNGLIVGSFTGIKDNDTPFGKTVEEIILDAVLEYNYPVIFQFPAGHQKENYALKLGCPININVQKDRVQITQN